MRKKQNLIKKIVSGLNERLSRCDLCPRECGVDRIHGERGICSAGNDILIYSNFLHKGEEPVISGSGGSGTIFFSGCPLRCVYCQNYKFSHFPNGEKNTIEDVADKMIRLQTDGAHNINLVTPTHYLPYILKALDNAFDRGLNLPIVYNTSGYEKRDIIELLDGIIDVYLPDMKYIDSDVSKKYSKAEDYFLRGNESLKEMQRQVSRTVMDSDGMMKRGLIVRHLVLPGCADKSVKIINWLSANLTDFKVSLMCQFQPYFTARDYPEINRRVSPEEYDIVVNEMIKLDIDGWAQDYDTDEDLAGIYL
ncbi:MAG: radical SAM protein [Candidatus Omnitrophica bacterium]|nr:radical SAM protein [Candidatus Omnitrophota bacterium]